MFRGQEVKVGDWCPSSGTRAPVGRFAEHYLLTVAGVFAVEALAALIPGLA
jgi:hypothetical protein